MTSIEEDFIEAFFDFEDTARSNVGFDQEKFDRLCECLKSLEPVIRERQAVSLEIANVFIDLYGSLESDSHRHDDEIGQKLRYAADTLSQIARSITSTN